MAVSLAGNYKKLMHAAAAWLVVCVLAAHGFIPAGYMPDMGRSNGVALVLCSGMDMAPMAMGAHGGTGHSSKDKADDSKHSEHFVCPFSAASIFASADSAIADFAQFYFALGLTLVPAALFAALRGFGNASARSPPVFS